jgi:hypothetical protein
LQQREEVQELLYEEESVKRDDEPWSNCSYAGQEEREMIEPSLQDALLQAVAQLPPPLQQTVVNYARTLAEGRPRGTPAHELLKLAGTLDPEDAREMMEAIEEGCERIDLDGW